MSINKISFLNDVILYGDRNDITYISNPSTSVFHFFDLKEIEQFLEVLDKDKTYVLSLELVYS
jgi:hypothetical protein